MGNFMVGSSCAALGLSLYVALVGLGPRSPPARVKGVAAMALVVANP
jgi:hypothetical protein